MSWYQQIKPIITNFFGLSKDAVHIHIGFFCLLAYLLISKRKMNSWSVLIPGFILSVVMEILDLRDGHVYAGSLHLGASLHDVINTNLIPVALVIMAKRKLI